MIVHPIIDYAAVITVLEKYEDLGGLIEGAEAHVELLKTQQGPEPFESARTVTILKGDVRGDILEGLKKLAVALRYPDSRAAFEFLLARLYLAARRKGIEYAAECLQKQVREENG